MMKKCLWSVVLCLVVWSAEAQFQTSSDGRYILRDGKPFFWLGDTAWELFHRLNKEQADYYLHKRAEQGFTVIQAVVLAEFDGLREANPYGDLPLLYDDPRQPNEKYFQHVDYIIDAAAKVGLTIALLPTWGDKLFKSTWGAGPEVFTEANAKVYGQWIGQRYKDRKNVIWVLGGDRNPRHDQDVRVWRAMAAGIQDGVGGADKAYMTFHPQPHDLGSAAWFHEDTWLDVNMFQTGHCRDLPVYDNMQKAYQLTPAKPVLEGEPIYEDHPVCFNAKDLGTSNTIDVRKAIYLDLFAGACGATYGCHDVWQMYSPYRPAVNGPHVYWQQALELPAANQMKYVRRLMESRPMLDRVPDQTMVVENALGPADRIQATRGKDYLMVYSAYGLPFTVHLSKISGAELQVTWFDPRTGETKSMDKIQNRGSHKFHPPTSGYGRDWVLLLDDAQKGYTKP